MEINDTELPLVIAEFNEVDVLMIQTKSEDSVVPDGEGDTRWRG